MSTPAERALALSVVAIKLRAFAWGDVESVVLTNKEVAARASVAIDELLELRDQALEMGEAFAAWEHEQLQAAARRTAANAHRAATRERLRGRDAQLGAPSAVGGAIA